MSSARDRHLSPCQSPLWRASHRSPALQPAAALLCALCYVYLRATASFACCWRCTLTLRNGSSDGFSGDFGAPDAEVRCPNAQSVSPDGPDPREQWSAVGFSVGQGSGHGSAGTHPQALAPLPAASCHSLSSLQTMVGLAYLCAAIVVHMIFGARVSAFAYNISYQHWFKEINITRLFLIASRCGSFLLYLALGTMLRPSSSTPGCLDTSDLVLHSTKPSLRSRTISLAPRLCSAQN